MKLLILLLAFAVVAAPAFADENSAKVLKVIGEVFVETESGKNTIAKKDKIPAGSLVFSETGKSYVRLRLGKSKLALKGKFKFRLPQIEKGKAKTTELIYGKLRALVKDNKDFKVKTPTSVAGVRGTDFFISYLPLLGESEVICFESEIDFSAGESSQRIKQGQWGGHGGRFGGTIEKPISLPENVLEHFSQALPIGK